MQIRPQKTKVGVDMAYSRMIRHNFFKSPQISLYSIKERYFLIGLICCADDFGKFWLNNKKIMADIFSGDEKISNKWIDTTIEKFVNDNVLCYYEVSGIAYCHFPNWFVPGWFLKQRLDHPRDNENPDCPICQTEKIARKKREKSRTIKSKSIEKNKNKTTDTHTNGQLPKQIGEIFRDA